MNPLCTSFPIDLRRIARSGAARLLAGVLAFVLVAANVAVAAMPLSAAKTADQGRAVAEQMHSGSHCAGHAPHAAATHDGHDADCGCCFGKGCACAQACDAAVPLVLMGAAMPPARMFRPQSSRAYAAIEHPLLRPPIV